MTLQEIKKFARQGDIDEATIIAVKDEGMDGDGQYQFYLCAHVKEFPAIVLQEDSWNEDALIAQARNLYDAVFADMFEKEKIKMPKIKNFVVQIVPEEEYFEIINA